MVGAAVNANDDVKFAEATLWLDSLQRRITVSIGVAVFDGHHSHDLPSWMRAADQALYSAKEHGRNRVVASILAP